MISLTNHAGGLGLNFEDDIRLCYARGGDVTQGDLVCLNLGSEEDQITGDSLTPTIVPGGKTSVFGSVTKAYSDRAAAYGVFAIALENVKDQALGRFQFRGLIERARGVRSDNAATTNSVILGQCGVASRSSTGSPSSVSNAGMIEWQFQGVSPVATASITTKVIAISREAKSATASATSVMQNYKILFDGITGFGGIQS